MKESAERDGNKNAVKNIEYIYDTPNGKHFEIDSESKPIESLIIKSDRSKQHKPLNEQKDEEEIIYYFDKIEKYAERYYAITDDLMMEAISPEIAMMMFAKLETEHVELGATFRAKGICDFVTGKDYTALRYYGKANEINQSDFKALLLMSMGEANAGNIQKAVMAFKSASKLQPKITKNFWELQYIKDKRPHVYGAWEAMVNKNIQPDSIPWGKKID